MSSLILLSFFTALVDAARYIVAQPLNHIIKSYTLALISLTLAGAIYMAVKGALKTGRIQPGCPVLLFAALEIAACYSNSHWKAFLLSLCALLIIFTAGLLQPQLKTTGDCRYFFLKLIGVVSFVALPIRLWRFFEFPRDFEAEFAESGYQALLAALNGKSITVQMLNPFNDNFMLILNKIHLLATDLWALLFKVFGPSLDTMKILPVSFGLATILIIGISAALLYSKQVGVLTAFFAATSLWMTAYSRNLWTHLAMTFCIGALLIGLFGLLVKKQSPTLIILMAMLSGLCMYLYRALYIVPLIYVIILVPIYLRCRRSGDSKKVRSILNAAVVFGLLLIPFLYYFISKDYFTAINRLLITGRASSNNVFTLLTHNLKTALLSLFAIPPLPVSGEISHLWGYSGALHTPLEAGLGAFGLAVTLREVQHNKNSSLLLLWFFIGMLPFLVSGYFQRRLLLTEIPFCIFEARAVIILFEQAQSLFSNKITVRMGFLFILFLQTAFNWNSYATFQEKQAGNPIVTQAQYISSALSLSTIIVVKPYYGVSNLVYLLSIDKPAFSQINIRYLTVQTDKNLCDLKVDPNTAYVQIIREVMRMPAKKRLKLTKKLKAISSTTESVQLGSISADHKPLALVVGMAASDFSKICPKLLRVGFD
ncbi:MAG: hypothetical protein D6719_10150 [Candidatus Dadabacteria bacterium]|nr:MAG: hypothetical protein D6719_10150 [Candidatus Dadabacteria bacterium]